MNEPLHPQVRVLRDGQPVYLDAGLVNLVRALWRLDYDSISSCQHLEGTMRAFVGFRTLADAERFVSEFGGDIIVPNEEEYAHASEASREAGFSVEGAAGVCWPVTETKAMTTKVASVVKTQA